jgi:hypothetical protein
MEIKLRTPNSELRTFRERNPEPATLPLAFDAMLSQVEAAQLKKILFGGEGTSGISSYLAGWMAGGGMDVIVLDGANAFDPYRVSSFARKALMSPERLLKRIRIARAFTCYQMAALITEKLVSLLRPSPFRQHPRKPCVILLGPVTTFLDEDVPEREVGPLFERSLRRMEMMAGEGVPFFLFQPHAFSQHHAGKEVSKNPKGRMAGWMGSKRTYLMKRLFQFSNLAWKISLEDDEPKLILEKGLVQIESENSSSPHGGGRFRWGAKGPGRPPPSFPSPIIRGKEMR